MKSSRYYEIIGCTAYVYDQPFTSKALSVSPKRNACGHQPKKPSKREQKKLDDLEAYLQWSLAFKARIKKENFHGEN